MNAIVAGNKDATIRIYEFLLDLASKLQARLFEAKTEHDLPKKQMLRDFPPIGRHLFLRDEVAEADLKRYCPKLHALWQTVQGREPLAGDEALAAAWTG